MTRNCLVLGAGRSGTSMVAGLFRHAYHQGERLRPADEANPRGYFEDAEVVEVNEALLRTAVAARASGWRRRLPWQWVRPREGERWLCRVPAGWRPSVDPALRPAMRRLVAREPWCLKDPRFCYTLPVWRPLLADVVFVCVFRQPERTVNSVLRMVWPEHGLPDYLLTRRRALRLWTDMYRAVLEEHERGGRWEFVHCDQVVDGSAVPRLERALGVAADVRFVDRRLQRAPDAGATTVEAQRVYRRLCDLASVTSGGTATATTPAAGRPAAPPPT